MIVASYREFMDRIDMFDPTVRIFILSMCGARQQFASFRWDMAWLAGEVPTTRPAATSSRSGTPTADGWQSGGTMNIFTPKTA